VLTIVLPLSVVACSVGSSMTVTPANELVTASTIPAASRLGLIIANRQPTPDFDRRSDVAVRVFGDADALCARVMRLLIDTPEHRAALTKATAAAVGTGGGGGGGGDGGSASASSALPKSFAEWEKSIRAKVKKYDKLRAQS
jgi:hypothetical protein